MKNTIVSISLMLGLLFASCGSNNTQHNHDTEEENNVSTEVKVINPAFTDMSAEVQQHIDAITKDYLQIKTALTEDNANSAQQSAAQLVSSIENFNKTALADSMQDEYSKYITAMHPQIQALSQTSDINEQRKLFSDISESMYGFVKAFGASQPVYHTYCSMAFDGDGGMWLSETEQVANPYYGSEMYKCGSVEEVIKK